MDNNENISVKREDVLEAYKNANDEQKACLEALFGKRALVQGVTDRVKTFEDACAEIGEGHPYVKAYKEWAKLGLFNQGDITAYLKLRIITAALNEGWEPQFTQDEWRWFPWIIFLADGELEERNEDWKDSHNLMNFDDFKGDWACFTSARSRYAPSYASAGIGSHLCYKSEALADYSGRQFADLWANFYLIRK